MITLSRVPTRNAKLTRGRKAALRVLRAELELGTNALRRGDALVVAASDLDGYLQSLTAPRRKRAR